MIQPKPSTFNVETVATPAQKEIRQQLYDILKACPIPADELVRNLTLFFPWQEVSRLLFMAELYQQILDVPGIVAEFGVRWGRNLALFANFRATFEAFNHNRKIVAFDTFSGLTEPTEKDGASQYAQKGALSVTKDYDRYLATILQFHEQGLPYEHMTRHELVKGDATKELPAYLERHPETIVAMAYFDMDLYAPTKACLNAILPYVTKGTLLAFDEVNHESFPGETVAVREVFGTQNIRLRRSKLNPLCGYFIVE